MIRRYTITCWTPDVGGRSDIIDAYDYADALQAARHRWPAAASHEVRPFEAPASGLRAYGPTGILTGDDALHHLRKHGILPTPTESPCACWHVGAPVRVRRVSRYCQLPEHAAEWHAKHGPAAVGHSGCATCDATTADVAHIERAFRSHAAGELGSPELSPQERGLPASPLERLIAMEGPLRDALAALTPCRCPRANMSGHVLHVPSCAFRGGKP